ncbi:hypothetical protein Tco_1082216 [Tanacetum coccineum]|uniref:Uncharacterized protein n=1 Tax=Tanacetum coccineum TaxID=301880 RepID=A0ABQ5I0X2_9ASTR
MGSPTSWDEIVECHTGDTKKPGCGRVLGQRMRQTFENRLGDELWKRVTFSVCLVITLRTQEVAQQACDYRAKGADVRRQR